MQTINVSRLAAEGADQVHPILMSKIVPILGMTSATGYLTAYSTDISTAATAIPQVINFIGTHGPVAIMSWADCIAVMSGLLVFLNLVFAAQKAYTMLCNGLKRLKAWFKKPRKRAKRNV